ncbi:MAG: hypothetical protein VX408_04185 [Pseudomonadota bacterium]|nr:hypothetical protein [Pseudomonadota bacterium]MED6318283.1 hypothetical protein [Pseudomonadota bacterium]
MPDRYYSAVNATKLIAASGSGTAISAVSVMVQLNEPHAFLHLQLPYWYFLIASIVLVFVGAVLAMTNDYMRQQGTFLGNLLLAITVGFVISFVILPAVNDKPTVTVMMLIAFFGGLLGTIFLRMILEVATDDELRASVVNIIKTSILESAGLIGDALKAFVGKWFGGRK